MSSSIAGIYLFKVNNGNIRTIYKICSSFVIKKSERHHCCHFGVSIVNIGTDFKYCSGGITLLDLDK